MARAKPIYPPGWRDFSRRIRYERAGGRCECLGTCGLHCTHPGRRRCVERDQFLAQWARGIVVLTVAHLCSCDPLCINPDHCFAYCQRCHLLTDMALHQRHAAETRRLAREAAGQLSFFKEY
jgi:hypothetical protein